MIVNSCINHYCNILLEVVTGVPITLAYTIVSVGIGLILSLLLTISQLSQITVLRLLSQAYVSVFRGTPLIIQLYIIYFSSISCNNIFIAGVLTFSLNSAAYITEIIRSGINAVDRGQIEAAKTLGVPQFYIIKDIILPQAFRCVLPALVNEIISLLKESSIISVIGGADLMHKARVLSLNSFDFFTPMLSAALCYYILVLVLSSLAYKLEKKIQHA